MENKRNLTTEEIDRLISRSCSSENWSDIWVPEDFNCDHIENSSFSGTVVLSNFNGVFTLPGGVKRHSGIYNATIHNCILEDDVLVGNIRNYIANYHIGRGCYLMNINSMLTDGVSSFGNDVKVSVLNETGGREVPIYDHLSASLAYVIALYRHRPGLTGRIQDKISAYAISVSSDMGIVGENVRITNTGTIKNVKIGSYAVVENSTRLENGTINSNREAPVFIGDSVIAQDFIISSNAIVSDAAKIIRCFVGQACHITHNFSAHDSLFFSNCAFENGEACAILAGPNTVSMHKSSLLIAGMFSFLNAGSGSNQSNHMYKLGPIHQGIVERGSKTTSDSYILWPARIGAFSLVMGRHYHHSDTSDMPFSYLLEKEDETYLVPGVNLRSVGTIRDAQKWPRRDKRTDPELLDMINYNLLSPYTVCKMIRALDILKCLQKLSGETSSIYYYQNTRIKSSSLQNALKLYNMAIRKFMGNSLISRLEKKPFATIEELREHLKPSEERGRGEWLDLSGLFLPKEELDKLMNAIETESGYSLQSIERFFREMQDKYYDLEWTWAYNEMQNFYHIDLQTMTIDDIIHFIEEWKEAVIGLDELLYKDAQKEFSLTSMTGFGVDGTKKEKQSDFDEVRGVFENNAFVNTIKDHINTKRALGDKMIARLKEL